MKVSGLAMVLVFWAVVAYSQSMVGINAKIYQTKGDFNKNVQAVPAGMSINYLYLVNNKFSVGGELV
ncbi:MAG: hypothetical protein HC811_01725 [Flammeovirgaceae bacterium]|nr:hypothetical protein [Flammeovirgaceae bacterium]